MTAKLKSTRSKRSNTISTNPYKIWEANLIQKLANEDINTYLHSKRVAIILAKIDTKTPNLSAKAAFCMISGKLSFQMR